MTLSEIKEILKRAGIEDYEYDARALYEHYSSTGAHARLLFGDVDVASPELSEAVRRRVHHEPLQYILGTVGFYREEYIVSDAVLIPRQDTEHLVDYAVKSLPDGARFADICTGSGCIAISTLANTHGTTAVMVDVSPRALEVAKMNAEKNGLATRIELVELDIKTGFPMGKFDAILSNPPYVRDDVYEELSSEVKHEPKIAFVGGEDGGDFYRIILPRALSALKDGGFIAFEIGYDQAPLMSELRDKYDLTLEIIKDYSGLDRVAVFNRKNV